MKINPFKICCKKKNVFQSTSKHQLNNIIQNVKNCFLPLFLHKFDFRLYASINFLSRKENTKLFSADFSIDTKISSHFYLIFEKQVPIYTLISTLTLTIFTKIN